MNFVYLFLHDKEIRGEVLTAVKQTFVIVWLTFLSTLILNSDNIGTGIVAGIILLGTLYFLYKKYQKYKEEVEENKKGGINA